MNNGLVVLLRELCRFRLIRVVCKRRVEYLHRLPVDVQRTTSWALNSQTCQFTKQPYGMELLGANRLAAISILAA